MRGPLAGIRVLDFGLAVAGPWGTQLLADLGADVVKVDPVQQRAWLANRMGMSVNAGKRSIGLDMKTPEGLRLAHELIAGADVVALNMRPQAAARLGLDYESLRAINPRLVYCHTRGFEDGPRSQLPGTDQTANALGGGMWENGGCWNGGRPHFGTGSGGDLGNGFLSAIAMVQALYDRERTGEGQQVDTAILNAVLFNVSRVLTTEDGKPVDRPRTDADQMGFSALYRLYECAEGWICLAAVGSGDWERLAGAVPGLQDDERFESEPERRTNDAELARVIGAVLRQRTADEWFAVLDAAGVPCEVYSPTYASTFFDDPELRAREWVVTRRGHPHAGAVDMFGTAIDFSATPSTPAGASPVLGQHTREILTELGYDSSAIGALAGAGAVVIADVIDTDETGAS